MSYSTTSVQSKSEAVSLQQHIAQFREQRTPFFFYNLEVLRETLKAMKAVTDPLGYHVHYAFKANSNPRILEVIREHGLGADCVSGNEVKRAVETGFAS
ncbi:MAG: hypothetical protein KDD36_15150, partial [Flavobacteriales bacterium]|nr:hypothetical protein [Flavobacteriales bacterium]